MVPDFTVVQHGLDLYGRPVYMTRFMEQWFEDYCAELGWVPRIAQGAYMERLGGGAVASQGAHDKAKCLDLETEGRTTVQIDLMVRTARVRGAGAYRRDRTWRHGSMPPHMHLTLGADAPGSPMAEILWQSYVSGGDGLAIEPPQPDYEWRPDPLVLVPPLGDDMPAPKDWDAADWAAFNKNVTPDLVKALLDEAKVDKAETVSVRQSLNQTRNDAAKAAEKMRS